MSGNTPMTQHSGLLALACLLDSLLKLDAATPALGRSVDGIVTKSATFAYAIQVATRMIYREMQHLDWLYNSTAEEALTDAVYGRCEELGWQSGRIEDDERVPTDEEIMRVLTEPMPAAPLLMLFYRGLKVEPPELLKRAAEALAQPQAA